MDAAALMRTTSLQLSPDTSTFGPWARAPCRQLLLMLAQSLWPSTPHTSHSSSTTLVRTHSKLWQSRMLHCSLQLDESVYNNSIMLNMSLILGKDWFIVLQYSAIFSMLGLVSLNYPTKIRCMIVIDIIQQVNLLNNMLKWFTLHLRCVLWVQLLSAGSGSRCAGYWLRYWGRRGLLARQELLGHRLGHQRLH